MSTIVYAGLTAKRDIAAANESSRSQAPGLKPYIDALAALVPTEVLTLHALILSATTTTTGGSAGNGSTTVIQDPETLKYAFWGLVLLSIIIYVVSKKLAGVLTKLDWIRAIIPAVAFVGWTMMQRSTAFDAVCPHLKDAPRTVIGLFLAVILGLVAAALGKKADEANPVVTGKISVPGVH